MVFGTKMCIQPKLMFSKIKARVFASELFYEMVDEIVIKLLNSKPEEEWPL